MILLERSEDGFIAWFTAKFAYIELMTRAMYANATFADFIMELSVTQLVGYPYTRDNEERCNITFADLPTSGVNFSEFGVFPYSITDFAGIQDVQLASNPAYQFSRAAGS